MRTGRNKSRLFRDHKAALAIAGSAISLALCGHALASAVPVWTGSSGVFNHSSGIPVVGGSPLNVALNISSGTPVLSMHTFPLSPGNTNASAGLQHLESTTSTKIIIGSGTGVSQTDPSHIETASSEFVHFTAEWALNNGSFGAPIQGSFSLPIGAKVAAGGSASATVKVDWDYIVGPNEFALGSEYNMTQTFTTNTVTSFTAPTVLFSPNTIPQDAIMVLSADVTFTADNDNGPVFIEVPTTADFSDMGVLADQDGVMSIDVVVPEPSSLLMISTSASALLMRRRRKS